MSEQYYWHPRANIPATRDECWNYETGGNYVDEGTAVPVVFNREFNDWEFV